MSINHTSNGSLILLIWSFFNLFVSFLSIFLSILPQLVFAICTILSILQFHFFHDKKTGLLKSLHQCCLGLLSSFSPYQSDWCPYLILLLFLHNVQGHCLTLEICLMHQQHFPGYLAGNMFKHSRYSIH